MVTKKIRHTIIRNLFFILVIAILTRQSFCTDSPVARREPLGRTKSLMVVRKAKNKTDNQPRQSASSAGAQATKQPAKKIVPPKITNPAVSPSSFRPEMPLREAIDILRNITIPPLNIVVFWKDLDKNADITPDTPIGIDGVSGVTLKTQLNILLMSLSSGSLAKIGYTVVDNVIVIATKDSLPKSVQTRYYDIADIAAPPSMAGMMPMGMGIGMGMMPYGGMSPYGVVGTLGQLTQPGNTGYPNQNYSNQRQTSNRNSATPGRGIVFGGR